MAANCLAAFRDNLLRLFLRLGQHTFGLPFGLFAHRFRLGPPFRKSLVIEFFGEFLQFVFHDPSEYDAYLFPLYVRIRFHLSAPGCRQRASGLLGGNSDNGYSWASAASGIDGMLLEFRVQFLITGYAVSRTYGFQLRCLSE